MIDFDVRSIAAWGPGFGNWPELVDGLRSGTWAQDVPLKPERIPPRERRRSPQFVKMAVEVMSEACAAVDADPADLAVVFATAMSDMKTTDYMCRMLADTPAAVSPTRFHNSVNNAATGCWSIATGSRAPSNALCAFVHSAGMGLLEAATQVMAEQRPVLLVVQDEASPTGLAHVCASSAGLALAVLLAPVGQGGEALAHWRLATAPGPTPAVALPDTLSAACAGNPSADLLPFVLAHAEPENKNRVLEIPLHAGLGLRLSRIGTAGGAA